MNHAQALADVRHRLLAAAAALDPTACDQPALEALASELEAVIHRVRWLADVSEMDSETQDLRPYRPPVADATMRS